MQNIAIFGAGGLGREIACLIKNINKVTPIWKFIGFFDDGVEKGSIINNTEVLGGIQELNKWKDKLAVAICVGAPHTLFKIRQSITNRCIYFPNIYAPDTIFINRDSLDIGEGNIFSYSCIVSLDITIKDFNLFNGLVSIGHDAKIGSFNAIMPKVSISGGCVLNNNNFLGTGAVILQNIKIGNNVRIGANSTIFKHTKDNLLYIGNPASKFEY